MSTFMQEEIFEQKKILKTSYYTNKEEIEKLASLISSQKIKGFAVAARGSSLNACYYFKYLSEIFLGIPVVFLNPSVLSVYDGNLNLNGYAVFAVSQSGEAEDINLLMNMAKQQGAITIAVTNTPSSQLAKNFSHIFLNVGEEKSVAATKTFLAQMLIFYMFVKAMCDKNNMLTEEFALPGLIDATLRQQDSIRLLAEKSVSADTNVFVLSRGINFVVAAEIALKLKETCYVNATAYPLSEFQHGPFAVLDKSCTVVLFAPKDSNEDSYVNMAERIKAAKSKLIVFSDDKDMAALGDEFVLLPQTDQWFSPFVEVVAGQLFACFLSVKKGLNPDVPRGLKKITKTR